MEILKKLKVVKAAIERLDPGKPSEWHGNCVTVTLEGKPCRVCEGHARWSKSPLNKAETAALHTKGALMRARTGVQWAVKRGVTTKEAAEVLETALRNHAEKKARLAGLKKALARLRHLESELIGEIRCISENSMKEHQISYERTAQDRQKAGGWHHE